MGRIVAFPTRGEVLADVRGEGRVGHVSWHHDDGLVVISLWQGQACTGTLRIAAEDAPTLINALSAGLADRYGREAGTGPGASGSEVG